MDNEQRIQRVWIALDEAYFNNDLTQDVTDLLTDLMHLCKQQEINFETCLRMADIHFEAES